MKVNNTFDLGQTVYLRTDPDQCPRLVTGIVIRPTGLMYYLGHGKDESIHYDMEMSSERDVLMTSSN